MKSTADLKEFVQQVNPEHCTYEKKCARVKEILQELIEKFPRSIEPSVLKELDRIIAIVEAPFVQQRSSIHLGKLAYSIYFIRKKLSRNKAFLPFNHHFDIRLFPSVLYFTFGSKPVLSILTHAHLKDKYEIFDEEQILSIVRKSMPEIEVVKDSTYVFQSSKNTIKTLYFEIHKASGGCFSKEESKRLNQLLKQEVTFSVEQLVPRLFMIRNEEEILRNILTLSREIQFVSDLPQVMILFDQQNSQNVIFTIILVKIFKPNQSMILETFRKNSSNIEFFLERSQIVRYLRKKHPLEANVLRVKLLKDSSLLRIDRSLNFYLARQKISHLLTEALGEFRDYNGGIIIKQRETLACLREVFSQAPLKEPDLLENFYYSLSPIEAQATLPIKSLKAFFTLFLEAYNEEFTKTSDYVLKVKSDEKQLYILVRIPEESFKKEIDLIFSLFESLSYLVSCTISAHNTHFFGYLLVDIEPKIEKQLSQKITETLKNWKHKVESHQILRLTLGHPIVSLDPRIGGDQVSAFILKMLFEGLMRMNREGKLEYGVAEQVTISLDQKTYLFQLRPTLWSNQSLVSAYDFEYAWKKVLSPHFKTPFAYLFYPIKNAKPSKSGALHPDAIGVVALDDKTLKVELEFPTPYFLELTAHTIYSPTNRLIDQTHPNWPFEIRDAYVCNGAFQLTKNDPSTGYEFTKNPLYWDANNIWLDEISILKGNHHHCYEMFQKDHNHWVGAPLVTWDPGFISEKSAEQVNFVGATVYWHVFNNQCFPFNHKKIRKALSLGVNRLKLNQLFSIRPAISPIPSAHSQIENSILSIYCVEEAKNLFKEALAELNISLKDFPEIQLIYLTGSVRNQVAQFVKEEWESTFGIRCNIESLEWKVLFSKMTQGDFQIGGMTWESWINDPMYTLNAFRDVNDSINFAKWEHKGYQEVMSRIERETRFEKRKSYYLQAEKILLEEMPIMPVFLVEAPALKKKNFHIHYSSSLIDFKWGYFS